MQRDRSSGVDLARVAQIVGGFATAGAVFVGVTAGALTWWQVNESARSERRSTAMSIYARYLERAFEHPGLANPVDFGASAGSDPSLKYEWFVSNMLLAIERILEVDEAAEWDNAIAAQLCYHHKYLAQDTFQKYELKSYSIDLQRRIIVSNEARCS